MFGPRARATSVAFARVLMHRVIRFGMLSSMPLTLPARLPFSSRARVQRAGKDHATHGWRAAQN
eukprot:11159931-Lingulodinium_polyedra.AAC.1